MVGFAISRRVFNENPSLPVPLLLFVYLKERKSVWFSRKKIVILSLSLDYPLLERIPRLLSLVRRFSILFSSS